MQTEIDLIALAGGLESVYKHAFMQQGDPECAPYAVLNVISKTATRKLASDLLAEVMVARDLHVLLQGDRPRAPSDDADAWDEGLEAEVAPHIEAFAGVVGISRDWIIEHVCGAIQDDAGAMIALCAKVADEMVSHAMPNRGSVNKDLAALGVLAGDLKRRWENWGFTDGEFSSVNATISVPGEGGSNAVVITPTVHVPTTIAELDSARAQRITEAAAAHREKLLTVEPDVDEKPAPEVSEDALDAVAELFSAGPLTEPTVDGQPAPKRKRARRTGSAGGSNVIPSIIFEDLRAVGISDTEGADAIGRARSTWSRIASGKATEIGLDDAEFAALAQFIKSKLAQLREVEATLELYGAAA